MDRSLFNAQQKAYLREIKDNPMFLSILQTISTYTATPRFRPGEETTQVSNWKYVSGILQERESVINLLLLTEKKIPLEEIDGYIRGRKSNTGSE